jgi:predicted SAM-dependent methyltransferase
MISWTRPFTSYAKVQSWIGNLIRNRTFQLRRDRIRDLQYIDLGCGRNCHKDLLNIDYLWHPAIDICWDVTRGLPISRGSIRGIFSEHFLEHFPLETALSVLRECHRVLVTGRVLRIVVPDGELYMTTYCRRMSGDPTARFPFEASEKFEGTSSPILSVNRVFYQDRESLFGHRFMYDYDILQQLLLKAGFAEVRRCSFGCGQDPVLLKDSPNRACESLYVEAIR